MRGRRDGENKRLSANVQGETPHPGELMLDLFYGCVTIPVALRHELSCPIALASYTLATENMLPDSFELEHLVQQGASQLLGTVRRNEVIEIPLGFRHQRPQGLGVARFNRRVSSADDSLVARSQSSLQRSTGQVGAL